MTDLTNDFCSECGSYVFLAVGKVSITRVITLDKQKNTVSDASESKAMPVDGSFSLRCAACNTLQDMRTARVWFAAIAERELTEEEFDDGNAPKKPTLPRVIEEKDEEQSLPRKHVKKDLSGIIRVTATPLRQPDRKKGWKVGDDYFGCGKVVDVDANIGLSIEQADGQIKLLPWTSGKK
jgi:hypothetical protein